MKIQTFQPSMIRRVYTKADLQAFLDTMSMHAGHTLVFDLETTGLNEWLPTSRVSMATFTFGLDVNYAVPLSHPDSPFKGEWKAVLTRIAKGMRECRWVGQNVPFDVRWVFAMTGIDLSDHIETDTMLGSHLLNDLESTSLKPTAARVFGIPQWDDFDFKKIEAEQKKDPRYGRLDCPLSSERVPYFQLETYAVADTYYTEALRQYHIARLKTDPEVRRQLEAQPHPDPDDLETLRMGRYKQAIGDEAVGTLARMSIHGMMADREWCARRLEENEGVIAVREQELYDLIEDPLADIKRDDLSFNPNSNWFKAWASQMVAERKLREVGTTETGDVSWAESCLKRNERLGMTAAVPLMDLRTRTTENQFLRVWLETSQIDGRIHANFNFARTRTGRLSSSDPNLQQVSRVMKDAFIAAPGHVLVTADYSMIELRVAAHLGKIEPIQEALWDKVDLHKLIAATAARCRIEDVTKEMRQNGKPVNFGFLFGMGAPKFVSYAEDNYGVFFTHEQAVEMRQAFFTAWQGLDVWHDERRHEVMTTGQVVCPLGRIRRLPNGLSKNKYLRSEACRQAINTPVQSTASDMMLIAVNMLNRLGLKVVAIVHDAVLVECLEADAQRVAHIVKDVMENKVPEYLATRLGMHLSVPLVADTSFGYTWGTQTEFQAS